MPSKPKPVRHAGLPAPENITSHERGSLLRGEIGRVPPAGSPVTGGMKGGSQAGQKF
jgi:hypothetical protein